MKNLNLKPINLAYNIIFFVAFFALIGVNIAWSVPAGIVTGVALGFVSSPKAALFMAIQKEIWSTHVEEGLFADNKFLSTFEQAEKENIEGRVVHIAQAGTASNVEKNRAVLPATPQPRTDDLVSYQINEFTSDPIYVTNADTVELSYDKRNSVLKEDRKTLAKEVAQDVLLSVVKAQVGANTDLPASSILTTTGAAVPASAPGATGQRKAYALNDLQRGQAFFMTQDIWTEDRMFALLTPQAAVQMFPADSLITATYMAAVSPEERKAGIMYKAYGFNIMVRSTVYVLSDAGAFKPLSAATAATDNEGIVFYNGDALEFAMGDVEFFENEGDATYYTSICSFLVRCGARAKRKGYEGIMVLKQAPTV